MATQTINDFFSGVRMTLLAQAMAVKGPVPRVLPDAFYTPGPTKPYNDQVQWPSVTWSRAGASVIARNSPPRAINLGNTAWKYGTIFNMKEEMALDPDFLTALFSDYSMVSDRALSELNTRMMQFYQRTDTTRTQMVHSLIANGKIWIGSDGQVLSSSSGAVITMDGAVPTANQITKNGAGSTYNIGDFSNPATNIQAAMRGAQEYMVRLNGYVPTEAIYGTSIPEYFSNNTSLAPYLARNSNFRDALVAGQDIPNGFLGYNWTPARLAYAESASGTVTQTFASNFLALSPPANTGWYEFVEGGTLTPAGIAGAVEVKAETTMQSLLSSFRLVHGKYSYGVVKNHPVVGTSVVQGDCAGPLLKVPGAFMNGTVS